jgi:hypothetical protein
MAATARPGLVHADAAVGGQVKDRRHTEGPEGAGEQVADLFDSRQRQAEETGRDGALEKVVDTLEPRP